MKRYLLLVLAVCLVVCDSDEIANLAAEDIEGWWYTTTDSCTTALIAYLYTATDKTSGTTLRWTESFGCEEAPEIWSLVSSTSEEIVICFCSPDGNYYERWRRSPSCAGFVVDGGTAPDNFHYAPCCFVSFNPPPDCP